MLIDRRALLGVVAVERKGPQERHLVWTIKCETGAERHICNYRITRCFSCITVANHKISLAARTRARAASFLHVRPISEGDDSHTRSLANTHDRPHTLSSRLQRASCKTNAIRNSRPDHHRISQSHLLNTSVASIRNGGSRLSFKLQ
jgi:hypothetical protein